MSSVPKPDPHAALKYFQQKLECTAGPIELSRWIEAGEPLNIVDIRRFEDYSQGHIPGAINIPREPWDNPIHNVSFRGSPAPAWPAGRGR